MSVEQFGLIRPYNPSTEERREFERQLVFTADYLREQAAAFQFSLLRDFRQAYLQQKITVGPDVAAAFGRLFDLESVALRYHAYHARSMAFYYWRANRHLRMDVQDLYQTASLAILEAVYTYRGRCTFYTLCKIKMRCRLQYLIVQHEPLTGFAQSLGIVRRQLQAIIAKELCSLDRAFELLRLEREIPLEHEQKIRDSLKLQRDNRVPLAENERVSARDTDKQRELQEWIAHAIKKANLPERQLSVLTNFLETGQWINEETRKKHLRGTRDLWIREVKRKLRRILEADYDRVGGEEAIAST